MDRSRRRVTKIAKMKFFDAGLKETQFQPTYKERESPKHTANSLESR